MKKLLLIKVLLLGILHFATIGYARADEHKSLISSKDLTCFSEGTNKLQSEMEQSSKTASTHQLTVKKIFAGIAASYSPPVLSFKHHQHFHCEIFTGRYVSHLPLIFPFHHFW